MKIEVLFPELCNLYGDQGRQHSASGRPSMPEAEPGRYREPGDAPRATKEPVDLIYLGSMSESHQELAIRRLLPHAGVLRQYVESGGVLLATGNALELFEPYIQGGEAADSGAGPVPPATPSGTWSTGHTYVSGHLGDMKIVGARSQFSLFPMEISPHPLPLQVTRGYGIYLGRPEWEGHSLQELLCHLSAGAVFAKC
ncbi:MAG: hypothetical protein ACLSHU_02025 [Oscillospiraceae bacterium]